MENGNIIIYQLPDGQTTIEVTLENYTVWLSQKQIAELFGTQRPAITKHLNIIFKNNELDESSVCSFLEHTTSDGKKYETRYYSLDAVLSVGYSCAVNSSMASQ